MNEIISGQTQYIAMRKGLEGKRFYITLDKIKESYEVHETATYGIELILLNEFKALGVSCSVQWNNCFVIDRHQVLAAYEDDIGCEGQVPYAVSMEQYYASFPCRQVTGKGKIILQDHREVDKMLPAIIEIEDGVLKCTRKDVMWVPHEDVMANKLSIEQLLQRGKAFLALFDSGKGRDCDYWEGVADLDEIKRRDPSHQEACSLLIERLYN